LTGLAERYLTEYLDKIELAIAGLDEEQVWARSGEGTNSIGNLMLHLCGNLSLWVRAGLGKRRYIRDRAAEFAADRICSKDELLDRLRQVVEDSREIIASLEVGGLENALEVQGYDTDGRGVLFHAVEHMSYHTGQIVLLAKQALASTGGLEFYPHHRSE
jgi:uncharacterized damage-inducible protein DinB